MEAGRLGGINVKPLPGGLGDDKTTSSLKSLHEDIISAQRQKTN